MMKSVFFLCLITLLISELHCQPHQNNAVNWKSTRILVYTKNGKGYVHDNIPFAAECFKRLGKQNGFQTVVTDDPSVFTRDNLQQFSILVFTSTNNDVFDTDDQRLAFRQFIEAGGGFVGVHSAIGTERNWTWFKMMLGGSFDWHPKFQKYTLRVIDPEHPSMVGLPKEWVKSDECYFQKEMYPGTRTVLVHDLATLDATEAEKIKSHAGSFGSMYPATWYQKFDGGTIWITALGHDKKDYEDPTFVKHIFQGLQFVASELKPKAYTKAYARSINDPVQY